MAEPLTREAFQQMLEAELDDAHWANRVIDKINVLLDEHGHKVMPVEATEEMINALLDSLYDRNSYEVTIRRVIAAAPDVFKEK